MALFLLIIIYALSIISIALYKLIFRGKLNYIIVFICLYMPVYTTILSVVYLHTESKYLVFFFQYIKEVIIFLGVGTFVLYKKNFIDYAFRLVFIDYIFISFLCLAFIFMLLPIGEAEFVNKAIYFKNILLLGIMYFFGRNIKMIEFKIPKFVQIIFAVSIAALVLNLFEFFTYTHFQVHTGHSKYYEEVHDIEPTGSFYLTWTFETQALQKRFASFYSNPLEAASAVLFAFPIALIMFLNTRRGINKYYYGLVMVCLMLSLWLTFSRASIAAFFMQLLFIAFIFKYYRLIFSVLGLMLVLILYIIYWAPKDVQDFVYDTLTFQNPSSYGHLIEWIKGVESMISAPYGLGLAMSGNAFQVEESLRVGGENQFIIFGVQLGVLGLLLYVSLLALSIYYSARAYKLAENLKEKIIPFGAASIKFGLLMPLFTANAELYLYISLLSWWMVGYSVSVYNRYRL